MVQPHNTIATTLDEALDRLAESTLPILAGGTDFYPMLQDRSPPRSVLDISRVAELKGISCTDGKWRIGAATTWTDLIRTDLPTCFDALKAAGREVGSIQIQNRATIAGNLCNASPAADGVPPLLALDAHIELTSSSGKRELPLDEFIVGVRQTARRSDELLTAIHIPAGSDQSASLFSKLGARRYLVISIAMIAIVIDIDDHNHIRDIRIAVGACSPVARRLFSLEDELKDNTLSTASINAVLSQDHLAPLSPIDDIRASAQYRLDAVLELLRRMMTELAVSREAA